MEEPSHILEPGTVIRTHEVLGPTTGMLIQQRHLDARRPNAVGTIKGWVSGHGGDVYWVTHQDETVSAAYGWPEFELVQGP